MRQSKRQQIYNGELSNLDPYQLGKDLFSKNEEITDKNDPTQAFCGGKDDSPIWDVLNDFRDKMTKGWLAARHQEHTRRYKEQLAPFKQSIPKTGKIVLIEFPCNLGKRFKVRVEFVPEERDNVLVRFLDETNAYGQTKLMVVGYGAPGAFVKFFRIQD